jgi:H+/Cl- antiporter ClcA
MQPPLYTLGRFLKWTLLAAAVGGITGLTGTAFHYALELVTELRVHHPALILFLPLAGLAIVALYHVTGMRNDRGMTTVMRSVRRGEGVPLVTAPLIFVSTVLTHLFGGSAGREGAALQLGAGIGSKLGGLLGFSPTDLRIMLLCSMAGTFSALFGTPLTAVFFSIEFLSVGVIYYSGIYSCIVSSVVALIVSRLLSVHHVVYHLPELPTPSVPELLGVLALGVLLAILGILFCVSLHAGEQLSRILFKWRYLRIFVLGALIVLLTWRLGTDYNGASVPLLETALGGEARPYDFLLKLLFTVITIAAGYRGGEIVPTFCIGATFGVLCAPALGLSPDFAAALGLVGLFSAVTNAPIASILLAFELFGGQRMVCFSLVAIVGFLFSGNYSLYKGQTFVFSKRLGSFDESEAGELFSRDDGSKEKENLT